MPAISAAPHYGFQNTRSEAGIIEIGVLDPQGGPVNIIPYDTVMNRPGRWVAIKAGSIVNDTGGYHVGTVQTWPRQIGGSPRLRATKVEKQPVLFPDGVTYQCVVVTLEQK